MKHIGNINQKPLQKSLSGIVLTLLIFSTKASIATDEALLTKTPFGNMGKPGSCQWWSITQRKKAQRKK